jgi:hypothetical protein
MNPPLSAYAPTPPCAADAPWFRVSAEFEGAGWSYTLQFDSSEAARAWATARTAHHRRVVIDVEQRSFAECAELSAAEVDALAADLRYDQLKNAGELDRRDLSRAVDQRAPARGFA